jgi:hypothetical protein
MAGIRITGSPSCSIVAIALTAHVYNLDLHEICDDGHSYALE